MRCRLAERLVRHRSGNAAAETALVAPVVLLLLFAAVEMGNLFYTQHILTKAVRDGARYAARQTFSDYDMGGCTLGSDAETRTRRLVRTGQLANAAAAARLPGWDEEDEATTITVSVACDGSGGYGGVYGGNGGTAAAVTVQASVPYTPLVGSIAFDVTGRTLSAESEAAVAGI